MLCLVIPWPKTWHGWGEGGGHGRPSEAVQVGGHSE